MLSAAQVQLSAIPAQGTSPPTFGFAMSEVQELLGLVDAHGYTCGGTDKLTDLKG